MLMQSIGNALSHGLKSFENDNPDAFYDISINTYNDINDSFLRMIVEQFHNCTGNIVFIIQRFSSIYKIYGILERLYSFYNKNIPTDYLFYQGDKLDLTNKQKRYIILATNNYDMELVNDYLDNNLKYIIRINCDPIDYNLLFKYHYARYEKFIKSNNIRYINIDNRISDYIVCTNSNVVNDNN